MEGTRKQLSLGGREVQYTAARPNALQLTAQVGEEVVQCIPLNHLVNVGHIYLRKREAMRSNLAEALLLLVIVLLFLLPVCCCH